MPGAIANRKLLNPKSLSDALKMLRDEGPLTPMAGCTDLYVALNFGALKELRFLNLWRLDRLRTSRWPNEVEQGLQSVRTACEQDQIARDDVLKPGLVGRNAMFGGVANAYLPTLERRRKGAGVAGSVRYLFCWASARYRSLSPCPVRSEEEHRMSRDDEGRGRRGSGTDRRIGRKVRTASSSTDEHPP